MKAGTATKLVLNTLTTAAMIRLGKVYHNLLVDLKIGNTKLRDRAERILMTLSELSRPRARSLLAKAHGGTKTAIVMHECGVDYAQARRWLARSRGDLRAVMDRTTGDA